MPEPLILLVEDDPDDAFLALWEFKKSTPDTEIVQVSDGAEALDYCAHAGRFAASPAWRFPDLILLDLKLPGLSGLEVLRRLAANGDINRTAVVVLTSSALDSDRQAALSLGARAFFQKPVNGDEFARVVAAVRDLLRARRRAESP